MIIKKQQALSKLKSFSFQNEYGGILLWIPDKNEFLSVSFGDGSNTDDNYDDYLVITTYEFADSVVFADHFIEKDGGQIDFNNDTSNYNYDITKTVCDVLEFMYGEIYDFIPLQTYLH